MGNEKITDKATMLKMLGKDDMALRDADSSLRNDREFIYEILECPNAHVLEYLDYSFKRDKELVLRAVKADGNALQYASLPLRNDKEVVIEAVKSSANAFQYASNALRKDRSFVEQIGKINKEAVKYADTKLEDIPESLTYDEVKEKYPVDIDDDETKVKTYSALGNLYKSGKEVIKDPIEAAFWFSKAAEMGDKKALSSLITLYKQNSKKLNKEKFVSFDKINRLAIDSKDENLQKRMDDFAMSEAQKEFWDGGSSRSVYDGSAASYDYNYLRKWLDIPGQQGVFFFFTTLSFKCKIGKDKEKVLEILRKDGRIVEYICPYLMQDKDVLKLIIRYGDRLQNYIPENVLYDYELLELAAKSRCNIKKLLQPALYQELLKDLPELKKLFMLNHDFYPYLPDELKNDKDIINAIANK